ncbi:MAG TPA: hypothetical protein VFE23_08085 [Usitatibacter sp.]|jgi:DNA-binding transcriptional ArsR family regulator|nr:hypothetical protein [Usitatibacter sp.]
MTPATIRFLLGERSARRSLLEVLYAQGEAWVHLRELARRAGFSPPMVSKEMDRFLEAGVVLERRERNARLFRIDARSRLALELRELLTPVRVAEGAPRTPRPKRQAAHHRPSTLAEAAAKGTQHGRRDAMIREFCDEFYKAPGAARKAMLAREPARQGVQADAYYAAVAEHLALQSGLPIPAWTLAKERFLRRPFFPAGLESLKSSLLVESPVAFRRRMIFVGANPLSRPARSLS